MDESQDIFITETDFRKRYEYKPADLLGEGGFAQVYKAYDKQFHEYVALKFYNKGEKGKYDVLHEMKDSRYFSHKNIIRVHDAFVVRYEQAGTHSFIQVGVLEFANGGNLRDFIKTKPSEKDFIKVLTGILEGLSYLHIEKNILHRDLSPENILMCIDGNQWIPKISDFGISKKIDYGSIADSQKRSTQLLGKIEYMAPEQFYPEKFGINGKINTNVDLWAFGIILYELFLNRTPFGNETNENPLANIHSIVNDPVIDLESIPLPYRKVIERCLVKEAGRRVQNSEELISILSHNENLSIKKSKKTTSLSMGKKDLKNLKWGIIIIVTVIVITGGYFTLNFLLKHRSSKMIAEIEGLMKENRYKESIDMLNRLSANKRKTPLISELYRDCQIQLAKDSISALLTENRIREAIRYTENLPEDIKSDSGLMILYKQSKVIFITDSLNKLMESNDFKAGIVYYDALNEELKNNPGILQIYNKLLSDNASNAKNFIPDKKVQNIVTDTNNRKEDSLSIGPGSDNKTNLSAEGCEKYYSGQNLRISKAPDPNQIRLVSVCFTKSEMKILLEIQPLPSVVEISNPLSDKAFYITFNKNGKQEGKLKDVLGLITDQEHKISQPTRVNLIFNKLPDDVKIFSLLEGKNRDKGAFWDFIDIQLLN